MTRTFNIWQKAIAVRPLYVVGDTWVGPVLNAGAVFDITGEQDDTYPHTFTVQGFGDVPQDDVRFLPMEGIAIDELADVNARRQTAKGYGNIPKASKVRIVDANYRNRHGDFMRVEFNEQTYLVPQDKVAVLETKL